MKWRRLTGLLALALCAGCAARPAPQAQLRYPSELELAECIAVLPFENRTDNEQAGALVADVMATELLASGKFRVMLRPEAEARIRNQNISTPLKISPTFAAILGEIIGVDAVLHGVVERYAMRSFGPARKPDPQVRFSLRLVSARSGRVVWEGETQSLGSQRPAAFKLSSVALTQELSRDLVRRLAAPLAARLVHFGKPCGKPGDNLDLDGDGILNIVDRCPLEGGTVEHEGCPERSKYTGLARLSGDRLILPAPIRFRADTAELDPPSLPYLHSVAELLRQNTYLTKVLIEGYAAAGESEPRRREELAFSRAHTVKSFLVGLGVAGERLVAVGYGDVDRLKPGKSGVEFHIIEIDIAAAH